jgi:two-component system, OmpR family, response regulator
MKILIIEDDPTLNKNINDALKAEGLITESVFDGLLAERILKKEQFNCIIMDINLPGKTGFDLCRDFRMVNTYTPVLMLTAFDELEDKVKGFDSGADDYLTKPFYMRELLLRVQSLLKRSTSSIASEKSVIVVGDITINTGQKKVIRQGQEITLTPREYQIFLKLCENQGEIISKNDLIKDIWGSSFDAKTNAIEVYVNFLRSKIDKPFGSNIIKTKIGYGYYIETQEVNP